jgi:hypothetical protein
MPQLRETGKPDYSLANNALAPDSALRPALFAVSGRGGAIQLRLFERPDLTLDDAKIAKKEFPDPAYQAPRRGSDDPQLHCERKPGSAP